MAENGNLFSDETEFPEEKIKELNALVPEITEELLTSGMNSDELKRYGKGLSSSITLSKAEYAKSLAWALCTPSIFLNYYNSFDENSKAVFRTLAYSWGMMTHQAVLKIFNKSHFSDYTDDFSSLPFAFVVHYRYTTFISLPSAIKKCVRLQLNEIFPQNDGISDEEFQKSKGFFSVADGLSFFLNSPHIIQFLMDTDFFERDPAGQILKGTIQKVTKIAGLRSFPQGQIFSLDDYEEVFKKNLELSKTAIERTENARVSLALAFLTLSVPYFLKKKEKKAELMSLFSDPKRLYRRLLDNFFSAQTTIIDEKHLYPNVTLHSGYYYEDPNEYRADSLYKFIKLIKKNPPKDPEKFSAYLSRLDEEGLPDFFTFQNVAASTKMFYGTPGYSGGFYLNTTKEYIRKEGYYKYFVLEPGYTNLFLMLASLGLFEITWEVPCTKPEELFDIIEWNNDLSRFRNGRIGFIKITPLGEYTFGIRDNFEAAGLKQFAPPRLDENALIIHIEDGDKTMQIFLEQFCVPLSKTLYKADETKLKKMCRTQDEVTMIFKTLSARTEGKIPKIWETLKKDILGSFVTLKGEYDWVIFSLENQNDALVRCIEKLSRQGLCLKMEGKRVAVSEKKLPLFERRIEAEGFKLSN